VSETPSFEVDHSGFYRIHSLVYNPSTLDLSIVEIGVTTGFDVLHLLQQGGGNICGSLDVHGAINLVLPRWICHFFYNSYSREMASQQGLMEDMTRAYTSYQDFEDSFKGELMEVTTFPNPSVNELNVIAKVMDDELMTISIIDLRGRIINTMTIDSNSMVSDSMKIDLTNYVSGTYLVQFNSNYRNVTKKIVVTK